MLQQRQYFATHIFMVIQLQCMNFEVTNKMIYSIKIALFFSNEIEKKTWVFLLQKTSIFLAI